MEITFLKVPPCAWLRPQVWQRGFLLGPQPLMGGSSRSFIQGSSSRTWGAGTGAQDGGRPGGPGRISGVEPFLQCDHGRAQSRYQEGSSHLTWSPLRPSSPSVWSWARWPAGVGPPQRLDPSASAGAWSFPRVCEVCTQVPCTRACKGVSACMWAWASLCTCMYGQLYLWACVPTSGCDLAMCGLGVCTLLHVVALAP